VRGVCASDADVRRARRLRTVGWLLIEIATEIGVSEASVSRWVRGITRTSAGGLGGAPDIPPVAGEQRATVRGQRRRSGAPSACTVPPVIRRRVGR